MKLALRWIPTEVWVDVFRYPGKSRKELGEIADKLGRKFAEYLQFYLHEWGRWTLGNLQLKKDGFYICPLLERKPLSEKLDFVQTPMPENIKLFERISITYFDSSALAFLRQISTLLIDVNLRFHSINLTKHRTILDHLAPLIHRIKYMTFYHNAIPLMQQYFGQKLTQVKMLILHIDSESFDPTTAQAINFCINWLTSGEQGFSKPRFLHVSIVWENFQQFSMAVQKHFRSAKTQSTFFIELFCYENTDPSAHFHLENSLGEELHGQTKTDDPWIFQITRHQTSVAIARTKLQEWANKCSENHFKSNLIDLYNFTTIGQLDASSGANEVNDNGWEEDGPSTSKKSRN